MLLWKTCGDSNYLNQTTSRVQSRRKQLGLSSAWDLEGQPSLLLAKCLWSLCWKDIKKILTLADCFVFAPMEVFEFFNMLLYIFNPTAQARTQTTRRMSDPLGHSFFNRWMVWWTCSHNIMNSTNDSYNKNYKQLQVLSLQSSREGEKRTWKLQEEKCT